MVAVPRFGFGLRSEGASSRGFGRHRHLVFTIQSLAADFLEKTAVSPRSYCGYRNSFVLVCSHVAASWPCLSSWFFGRSGGYTRDVSGVVGTSKWNGSLPALNRHVSPLGSLGDPKTEERFGDCLEGKPSIFCLCDPLGTGDLRNGGTDQQILRALPVARRARVGPLAGVDTRSWRWFGSSKRAEGSSSFAPFFGGACGRGERLAAFYWFR